MELKLAARMLMRKEFWHGVGQAVFVFLEARAGRYPMAVPPKTPAYRGRPE